MFLEERARKYEYKLNDTDDQIIEYIMSNKRLVVSLSIQSLAASLYTVPNTITRLSKKLGYDGFSQLKNSLKDELETELEGHGELEGDLHATVQKTLQLIDMDKIEMVSKVLRDAKKILVYGVGDTVPFCEMLVKNLKVTGKQTEFYIHPHEIRHGIEELKSKDVLFLISLSGETDQVLKMAELGKDRLITIISLTHFNANALQKLADINLYCHAPKKVLNGYNVTDKTSLVIVLRVLSEYIWNEAG
ncbi:MurR/RpiR family transcriptional regulator [Bacillus canaveralius]|uniref:MurR/RpiR family transcriptional regulator n=1 Tax=Bacillus canaveralius TaxID=1403243 RepID=A0A2N5GQA0_9BACI|nr:MurR/RpiR family transcriptional regulator [Bacillus canaveralius]PLR85044.1 MurR/RpiR family transcriptional regulator [Bacillus canaveralius]PLS00958.1 MurR/RpiR family transcriptional regulator [Bacillus canaveralius]RSK54176.1 MurR/RpiR family transcriptional regulator [Bacillus canaveralius]